ncbi:sodium:proton antiporter [Paraburkholderia sp. J10-1]|uniref:cation:proton antiporter n=1 Tax=Paraburkholderia sp. J10-1 TaxID=2805430 RepID=UPI002AB7E5E4|nr:sodium:proton antiporter [Paraburkholderia sp. J10-1]
MDFNVGLFEVLLLVSALVAMLVRRLHMPYSVGLVVAGIALSFLASSRFPDIPLNEDFIYNVLLPPLIFEAAFHMRWGEIRRDFAVVQTLAIVGVLVSAGVTAIGMRYLLHWEWISGLLFGMLIAATDPVSVLATFREAGVAGRFRHLMEAESLFNDGTAAAGFRVVLAFVGGAQVHPLDVLRISGVVLLGSLFCGLLIGNVVLSLLHRTDDHLVEIAFAMIASYGSFLLAENLHLSGVLATLVAGLVMGTRNAVNPMTKRGREAVENVLEYAVFAANSFIFLFIGIQQAQRTYETVWVSIGIAVVVVMLARAVAVYPCCMLFSRSSLRIEARHQHVLFWGGMRGALALALAMGSPAGVPRREEIVTVSFAVVAFSIFVQGTTMTTLLRRLRIV